MAIEIERRFLLKNSFEWEPEASGPRRITQVYLGYDPVVRLRVYEKFGSPACSALMTIKGGRKPGQLGKTEIEWQIPQARAKEIVLSDVSLGDAIVKDRYTLMHDDGMLWEIDVFHGLNQGLLIAEVELSSEAQKITLPSWVGEEITDDHRYANSNLAQKPFSKW